MDNPIIVSQIELATLRMDEIVEQAKGELQGSSDLVVTWLIEMTIMMREDLLYNYKENKVFNYKWAAELLKYLKEIEEYLKLKWHAWDGIVPRALT